MIQAEDIKSGREKLAVVGLGYVGMPIAVAFAREGVNVIGFDINRKKIETYQRGIDPTGEVGNEILQKTKMQFTSDASKLKEAKFIIVAVPTPVNQDHTPDLSPVTRASEIVGKYLNRGAIVCFESTVYPGVTEDECLPILQRESGFLCGKDFSIGYSPERINPGDKVHRLDNIVKIVSGWDEKTKDTIKEIYEIVVKAGTYPVSSIKTAEAVKIAENSQRDINIAFMNELAMVFDRMNIDTKEVVGGMNTKWNALGFYPGLVGGHCIGVDPYYFTYEAERLGYHSQIILSGRKVNDGMGEFVADAAVRQMILAGKAPRLARVVIFGLTFKENCPDIRNSKVVDILKRFREYGIIPDVVDPWVSCKEEKSDLPSKQVKDLEQIHDMDCIIVAVAHDEFRAMPLAFYRGLFKASNRSDENILIDVKSIFDTAEVSAMGWRYWRL